MHTPRNPTTTTTPRSISTVFKALCALTRTEVIIKQYMKHKMSQRAVHKMQREVRRGAGRARRMHVHDSWLRLLRMRPVCLGIARGMPALLGACHGGFVVSHCAWGGLAGWESDGQAPGLAGTP